jgi:predicted enzyme related to lactoylglutathione lyase
MASIISLSWFEIPVQDIYRAKKFYETIFGLKSMIITPLEISGGVMADFANPGGKPYGALVQSTGYKPSEEGVLVYFNANPDLQLILNEVELAGGKIILNKKLITPSIGYMAIIKDTEQNKVALHSMQ